MGHDPDATWHALRGMAFDRIRRFVRRGREGAWDAEAYYGIYDRPARGPRRAISEGEDPSTYAGAFWLAFVKTFDLTIEGHRVEGYNALSDWDELRDYLFRKRRPEELAALAASGALKIHGGNAAWSRQQRAPDLFRHPKLQEAVERVVFGEGGATPDRLDVAGVVARLETATAWARRERVPGLSIPFASKLLHVFDPVRWPVVSVRAASDDALELPPVEAPGDYAAFVGAVQRAARERGHADADWMDIAFTNAFEADVGEADEADEAGQEVLEE